MDVVYGQKTRVIRCPFALCKPLMKDIALAGAGGAGGDKQCEVVPSFLSTGSHDGGQFRFCFLFRCPCSDSFTLAA